MSVIAELAPSQLWKQFAKLCEIPRPSKHEQKVVEYILSLAKERGLNAQLDKIGNVILKKTATPGMENRQPLALQSHLDMVPQKNADSDHNFITDSIRPQIDGDWVTATGTTLGADNGIGAAAILALMESTDIPHGPLEALLTIDEEAGMTGAKNLQPGYFDAQLLLNLDTEDEGELYVGCAGGIDVNAVLPYSVEPVPSDHLAFKLTVRGLRGGHSGLDIDKGRGNANRIANQVIDAAQTTLTSLRIASIDGGSLRNAIARESFSVLTLADSEASQLKKIVAEQSDAIARQFNNEPKLSITLEATETPASAMDLPSQQKLIRALRCCPHGVERMSSTLEGVVETSNNFARIVTETEAGNCQVRIQCLIRSLSDETRDQHGLNVAAAFELAGACTKFDNAYPGWAPNMQSPLLALMQRVYQNLTNQEAKVKVIHAGLECGLLAKPYPNWDMVSFGPTIRHAHSPVERVHIKSVENFWQYLLEVIQAIPERA